MDVISAVDWLRDAGINNINLDLIFGLPNQELSSWQKSVETALSLNPEHLSIYSLTIEMVRHSTIYEIRRVIRTRSVLADM
jgi:oxygen-independent coproporphyrinogen-3 oxidase